MNERLAVPSEPVPNEEMLDPDRLQHSLSAKVRWVAALGGGALVVTGAIATFVPGRSDLGAVALIALGALLLILAILGAFPTRFRMGGTEFDMGRFASEASAAMEREEVPLSVRTAVLGSIQHQAPESDAVRAVETRARTEAQAVRGLAETLRVVLGDGFEVEEEVRIPTPGRGRPLLIDVVARRLIDNRALAIERVGSWRPSQYMTPAKRIESAIEAGGVFAGILLVDDALEIQVSRAVQHERVMVVRASEVADPDALKAIVLDSLA